MKNKLQTARLIIQILGIILTFLGFFINYQVTTAIIIAITIFAGAYFCGWICPFGTIQELLGRLGKFIGLPQYKMPKSIQKYLKFSRYILAILFGLFTLNILFTLFNYDPRNNLDNILQGKAISLVAIIIIISFLIIAMFFERPFCNYLCIEGAKQGILSSLRIYTIKRNTKTCINCKKCDKVCAMNIEVSKTKQLHSTQCINCFECIDACPVKETLTYNKITKTPSITKYYITAISLIATILLSNIIYGNITGSYLISIETPHFITKLQDKLTAVNVNNNDASDIVDVIAVTNDNVVDIDTNDSDSVANDNVANNDVTNDNTTNNDVANDNAANNDVANDNAANNDVTNDNAANNDVANDNAANNDVASDNISDSNIQESQNNMNTSADDQSTIFGEATGISDGSYTGIGEGYNNYIVVEITIVDQLITKIEVTDHEDDWKWFIRAYNTISKTIVDVQSTDVDVVSGSTYSSQGIIQGVQDALNSAR